MTNKIRITIYIKKGVWEEVKEIAWERRESASAFLEKLIKSGKKKFTSSPRDEKCESFKTEIKEPVKEQPVPKPEISESEKVKVQAAGQAEYDSAREKRNIKKEKIELVKSRVPVESLTRFSGAYSKEHQTRKKVK
jgi:hypothetical protein